MERANRRNLEQKNLHPEFYHSIIPPSEDQVRLTETWIFPYHELILNDVRSLRRDADRRFSKDTVMRNGLREWGEKYPKGRCQEIRDDVLNRMQKGMLNTEYQGLQMVKNFVRQGGIIQPFWGVDKDKYFQNAIQVGDSILDVANDTVDPSKEAVVFYPRVAEAPIKRIETFEKFAEVAETYWDYEIYPNIYFPHVAPIYPVIAIEKAKKGPVPFADRLIIPSDTRDLQYRNLYSEYNGTLFGLASHFMFDSEYSNKRLPDSMLKSLMESKLVKKLEHFRKDFYEVTTDPDEAHAVFQRFTLPEPNALVGASILEDANQMLQMGKRLTRYYLGTVPR